MNLARALSVMICVSVASHVTTAATVSARASSNSVRVAEPFTLEVTVTAAEGSKVTFPTIQEKLGEFDVHGKQDMFDVPSLDSNGQRIWNRRLTLETIMTGNLIVPSFDIQVSESGTATTLQTQTIPMDVVSVLEDRRDPTTFRDIESVVDVDVTVPDSDTWVLATLASAVALTLLAATAIVFWGRRGEMTPEDWASQELDQLAVSVNANGIDNRTVVERISVVIRNYLQLRLGTDQSGRTWRQLLHEIVSGKQFDANVTTRIQDLFELADKVKFAELDLLDADTKDAINGARELMEMISDSLNRGPGIQPINGQVQPDSRAGLDRTAHVSENR